MLFVLAFLGPGWLSAQERSKAFVPASDTVFVDSGMILPASLRIFHADTLLKSDRDYRLMPGRHAVLLSPVFRGKSLRAVYVLLPPDYFAPRNRRLLRIENPGQPLTLPAAEGITGGTPSSGQDLITDGVLLRGISFGNAQDLVLNSSLNLRMAGRLSPGLNLEAALTDQEYPFQPEGTTSSVQDFDRIYVRAFSNKWSVLLGDHALTGPSMATYSKFAKKNRGIQVKLEDTLKGWHVGGEADAAIARGRFSRNEFPGTEGLQGPYRLSGARGEPFIIVVSGTEVVYLDGKRMERGYQADYIIDYNLGEITFTPKRLIGQNSRIVVEFQYTDRFYSRVVGAASVFARKNKTGLFASTFTESDLGNQPIQQDLEMYDSTRGLTSRQIMQLAGDNPQLAVMNGARMQAGFNPSAPNYALRDSGGVRFYEFRAAPDTFSKWYAVTFSYVGPGQGRYVTAAATANGKVYRYVGLNNGVPAGDYEPVNVLRTPNRTALHEAGAELSTGKGQTLKLTGAVSAVDQNLFSAAGDKDNRGRALSLEWNQKTAPVKHPDSSRRWILANRVTGEWTSEGFSTVERVRDVEFGRIWTRELFNPGNGSSTSANRYIVHQAEASNRHFRLNGRWGLNESQGISASNALLSVTASDRGWFISPGGEISKAVTSEENRFRRLSMEAGYRKNNSGIRAEAWSEQSMFYHLRETDSLMARTYGYDQLKLEARKQVGRLTGSVEMARRTNRFALSNRLADASVVHQAGGELNIRGARSGFLRFGGNFRLMDLVDSAFSGQFRDERHFTGRMEWSFPRLLPGLGGNLFYQTLSGREQQRQFSYFEVPAGQGFYTWVDFNGNGIQEINEFQDAPFRDQARFVRLLVPTGTYITAQTVEWNGNLTWKPEALKRLGFSNRLSWNLNGRNTIQSSLLRYLPLPGNLESADVLAATSLLRNQAEVELLKRRWLLQLTSLARGNKAMFTNGPELRQGITHTLFQRFDAGKSWQIRLNGEWKTSGLNSAFVPLLSYRYRAWAAEPSVVWQSGVKMRLTLACKVGYADSVGDVRLSNWAEWQVGLNRSVGKSGMLELKASVLDNRYTGPLNTPLSFDVLQGFSQGRNLRIQTDLRMTAARNVQVVISYETRKAGEAPFIHIGRAEARYLF